MIGGFDLAGGGAVDALVSHYLPRIVGCRPSVRAGTLDWEQRKGVLRNGAAAAGIDECR